MIEWYNEKLLPRGLPELIYQICPRRVSPLKIIVNRRKSEESICGSVKKATKPHFHIELYPTVIFQDNQTYGQTVKWGVRSFRYWVIPLEVTLHEIGHCLHIVGLLKIPSRDEEEMANLWAFQKMEVIGRRNPRLGQPDGFIGGLPGAYIIRKRAQKLDFSQGPRATFNFDDYRAYKCGGQFTVTDVARAYFKAYGGPSKKLENFGKPDPKQLRVLRYAVYRSATGLGINRLYVDRAGRKHRFFNYREAEIVFEDLIQQADDLTMRLAEPSITHNEQTYRPGEDEYEILHKIMTPEELIHLCRQVFPGCRVLQEGVEAKKQEQ